MKMGSKDANREYEKNMKLDICDECMRKLGVIKTLENRILVLNRELERVKELNDELNDRALD